MASLQNDLMTNTRQVIILVHNNLFKYKNKETKATCEVCPKFPRKVPKRRFKDTHREKHPQMKLQRLQKV